MGIPAKRLKIENIIHQIDRKFTKHEVLEIRKVLSKILGNAPKEDYIKLYNAKDYYINSGKQYDKKMVQVKDLLGIFTLTKLLNHSILEPINLFFSVNTYLTKESAAEDNMSYILNLIIDIDYTDIPIYAKLPMEKFVRLLEQEVFGQVIPAPNIVTFTGTGIHLHYHLKRVRATEKSKIFAKKIQKELTNKLLEYGSDKNANLTTMERMPYTMNSKSTNIVEIKFYDNVEPYELRSLGEHLPPKPAWYDDWQEMKKQPWYAKWKEKKDKNLVPRKDAKVKRFFTTYSYLCARAEDIEGLVDTRNGYMPKQRELLLFIYRHTQCQITDNPDIALEKTLELNEKFWKPMRTDRLESKTRNGETNYFKHGKIYKYKSTTLVDLFDISEEEQKLMKVTFGPEEQARRQWENHKKQKERQKQERRNENGLNKREQAKADRTKDVQELIEKGLTPTEIAKKLGIGRATVYRHIK